MRRIVAICALMLGVMTTVFAAPKVSSPNGKLTADVQDNQLVISYNGQRALAMTVQGIAGQTMIGTGTVKADYQMLAGKKRHCTNEANEYQCGDVTLRMYNDGIAVRTSDICPQPSDIAYRIPEGTRRWMQQWCDSYEGFFPLDTTYKVLPVPSYSGTFKSAEGWNNRWGYPALIEPADGVFVLITEANIEKGQSASCLYNDGETYRVVEAERMDVAGETSDHKTTNGKTPWRVAIIGTLADVVESTLVTDVSEPCKIADTSWIHPGTVSWIYWAYNHGSNDYDIIKKYVDMAVTLGLPYVLIDAEWDEMKNGKTIEDALNYAKEKGIKPLIWYNSSVGWVDGAPTPKFRLNKPEDREREFAWCDKMGVAGVKIDFFSGDNQKNMDYCQDLLECAARHHLLVNFHGATVPRGWQRTWPNLMSTEGVYGAEWYNNVPTFTAKAARHNATLPFTRNVIGPMDYTPCTFRDSQHPHITTNGHELALTVLFESALQHLADRPESYLAQPQAVQDFFGYLPTTWDESRLVCGYPGEYVVMARRSGTTWYVAGINGSDEQRTLKFSLDFIKGDISEMTLFGDSGDKKNPWIIVPMFSLPSSLDLAPRGGFVLCIET